MDQMHRENSLPEIYHQQSDSGLSRLKSNEKSIQKSKMHSKTEFQDQMSNNNSSIFDSKLDVIGNTSNTKPQSEMGAFIDYDQVRKDGSVINNISMRKTKNDYVTGGDRSIGREELD